MRSDALPCTSLEARSCETQRLAFLTVMDPASPESQQASTYGLATLKKAVNVIAHYVDFSDNSSSWSGSQSDKDGAETPHSKDDLHTPLLQSDSGEDDKAATALNTASFTAETDLNDPPASTDKVSLLAAHENTPSDQVVQSPRDADSASSSSDGARTPKNQDLRTTVMQSPPVDHEIASPAQSESPKVPPSGGLENLGSGLLDPSLLKQLLDEHAPPPDMPYAPIRHVEPVNTPDHPGKQPACMPCWADCFVNALLCCLQHLHVMPTGATWGENCLFQLIYHQQLECH